MTIGSDLIVLVPELILAVGAMAALLIGAFWGDKSTKALSGLVVVVMAVAAYFAVTALDATAFHGAFVADGFSRFAKALILMSAALCTLMAQAFFEDEGRVRFELPVLIALSTLGMLLMVSAANFIALYLGMELQSLALYVLASFNRDSARSTEAGLKYFVLGALSSGMLLYGISLIYGFTGTIDFVGVAASVKASGVGIGLIFGLVFLIAGLAFKLSAVPFHMWAPDVYEGAPTPVTAFLSVGSKAASFAMLLRLFLEGMPSLSADWRILFEVLAIVTMTVGNLAALTQSNLKRMLAYSSIAHAGYLLIGIVAAGAGYTRGVTATLVYLFIYGFMQLGAFGIVILMRHQGVIGDELKDLTGLSHRRPVAAFAMLLFMLSLGGIPPTAGFMGKFWLFSSAIEAGFVWLAVIGVLNSAISLYYYIRVIVFMYLKKDATGDAPVFSPSLALAVGAAVVATIVLGVYPRLLFEVADASARTLGAAGLASPLR